MSKLIVFITIFIAYSACKTTSVPVQTPSAPKANVSAAILDTLKMHAFHFEWFQGKAKIEITEEDRKTEFTANFRIRNDSAIWLSVSPALGIEVARMFMTKDSIRVIDRLNKKSFTRGYNFFRSFTSLPVDYDVIQNLIAGNPLFHRSSCEVITTDSSISLVNKNDMSMDSLVISRNYLPIHQLIIDSLARILVTTYDKYDIQYSPPFSLWRRIILKRPKLTVIQITFSKVKLNEAVKFPFKGDD